MLTAEIRKTLLLVWPLLLGIGMIMLGNGLQGTLLGLRANLESFPVAVTGIIMSLYYCGFLAGCFIVPHLIKSVGHIRVFAALASLASTTILINGVFIDPLVWGCVRFLSGIAFAGLFVVTESWLNNIATNKYRARIFGCYIFVINAGLVMGQFLIGLAPLGGMGLFVLVSVLISLSLLPITLANTAAPVYSEPEPLPMRKLIAHSPLAVTGVLMSGFCGGAFVGFGPVYANTYGMDPHQVALFIASYIFGAAIMPLAVGWISDRIDRRHVLTGLGFCGTVTCLLLFYTHNHLLLIFCLGGIAISIYSIAIAYMNDRIKPEQVVSASTSLILLNGLGACGGPVLTGFLLQTIGTSSYFMTLAIAMLLVLLTGLYRMMVGKPVSVPDQKEYITLPTRSAATVLQISENTPPEAKQRT